MMSTFPASLLILNGKGANEPQLREAVNLLRDEGIDIHVRVTWEKGDAARFIDEALQLNVETVIAGGGDGTINEVATALVERGGKMALGFYRWARLTTLPPASVFRRTWPAPSSWRSSAAMCR